MTLSQKCTKAYHKGQKDAKTGKWSKGLAFETQEEQDAYMYGRRLVLGY